MRVTFRLRGRERAHVNKGHSDSLGQEEWQSLAETQYCHAGRLSYKGSVGVQNQLTAAVSCRKLTVQIGLSIFRTYPPQLQVMFVVKAFKM